MKYFRALTMSSEVILEEEMPPGYLGS